MSRAMILKPGTGGFWGAAGVKPAKLYVEQDQIGKRLSAASMKFSGRSLEGLSNWASRGMAANNWVLEKTQLLQNPAYSKF